MDSFEDLGIRPELVEALAAEGIEEPTPLQEAAVPLLRKGNNLILSAGPGSGLLAAWAVPLLERIPAEGAGARVMVVTSDRESAFRIAESTARLAQHTGHAVAALGSSWALPGRAHVLVGTPADLLAALRGGKVSPTDVQALVLDQAQNIEHVGGLEPVEQLLQFLPTGTQRVVSALPVTPAVADFTERHLKRTVTVPTAHDPTGTPQRGAVRFRVAPEPSDDAVAQLVGELLEDDVRHVLLFCRTEDRAADLGDQLTLRGYVAGAPGDGSVPVWLGVDALEARSAIEDREGVAVVSCDVPADPDTLDRRHGIGPGGVVLVKAREVAHLRDVARRTGYTLAPLPAPDGRGEDGILALHRTLEQALEREDLAPYLFALAPLFERHDPAEIAAAAVALLRKKGPVEVPRQAPAAVEGPKPAPSWAKLFVSVGSRDGLVPGDLLGAITGEASVPGDTVGRIDIKESHTLIEVHDTVARQVIRALNGTTIRGRAVRADFDRPRRSGGPGGRRPAPRG